MGSLLGEHDRHLRRIEEALPEADITVRGNEVHVSGPDASVAATLFEELVVLAERGQRVDERTLDRTIDMVRADEKPSSVFTHDILRADKGRVIRPKSAGQKAYVEAIADNVVTFGIGPAGTGKSWLAVAMAVRALQAGEVERIILTRPAVEAGERLGFLPGDMMAKVDPYLRPLYDALSDRLSMKRVKALMAEGAIEIAPIGYMRGRTLNNAFVVVDEAQNCTYVQLKMLLTRLGWHSTMVVTGDPHQSDLLPGVSGLSDIAEKLKQVPDIAVVHLAERDIVRHPLVASMIGVL